MSELLTVSEVAEILQDVPTVPDFRGQDQPDRDVGHVRFEFLNIIILPGSQYFFRAPPLQDR